MKRYAMRRDENEAEIVAALESCGCTVYRMDTPCDLLVGRGGQNILIEVKNPAKPKGDRQKTKTQKWFFEDWDGQIDIAETAEEAIALITKFTIRRT